MQKHYKCGNKNTKCLLRKQYVVYLIQFKTHHQTS